MAQVIEKDLWSATGFANKTLTLSVEDLTGGSLTVDIEGQAATITVGAGRREATITVPSGSTGNISVKISPLSGAVTFRLPKLEQGAAATPWVLRAISEELALCQRYYYKAPSGIRLALAWNTVSLYSQLIDFPVTMRIVPTIITPNWNFLSGSWTPATTTTSTGITSSNMNVLINKTGFTLDRTYMVSGGFEASCEL